MEDTWTSPYSFSYTVFIVIWLIYHNIHPLKREIQCFLYIHNVAEILALSNSRTFSSPQKETQYSLAVTPHFLPNPQGLAIASLPSVSMDLPILDILYKWNHIVCGPFHWLLSLSISQGLSMLHHISVLCSFSWLNNIPLDVYITFFSSHSSVNGHRGCFYILTIINNAVMNIYVQAFVWTYVSCFLGYLR